MSLHHQDRSTLDARVKAKEGPPKHHVAVDGGEITEDDGKDLEWHPNHSKGPAEL